MIHKVEITEVLKRIVDIETDDSDDSDEAIEIAKHKYYNEEIVLDYNDLKSEEFNIV